jgi:hypothetical protein
LWTATLWRTRGGLPLWTNKGFKEKVCPPAAMSGDENTHVVALERVIQAAALRATSISVGWGRRWGDDPEIEILGCGRISCSRLRAVDERNPSRNNTTGCEHRISRQPTSYGWRPSRGYGSVGWWGGWVVCAVWGKGYLLLAGQTLVRRWSEGRQTLFSHRMSQWFLLFTFETLKQ